MQTDAYITGGPFLTDPSTSCFVLAAQQARFEGRVRTVGINIDSVKSERTSSFLQMLGMEDLRRRFSEPPLVVRL
jgi:hypothetical protein